VGVFSVLLWVFVGVCGLPQVCVAAVVAVRVVGGGGSPLRARWWSRLQQGVCVMRSDRLLDAFDLEAMREGRAIAEFNRDYRVARPVTKAKAKRGVVRGKKGSDARQGLRAGDLETALAMVRGAARGE
jgi:hypothetical protein